MTAGARVEALLREAAITAAWPPTPDLRSSVLVRISAEGVQVGVRPARPRTLRLIRALAVAIVALLILAGVAAALGHRLPGLDILFVERLPPAGIGLDLGSPIPLAEARASDEPRVLVPATLPEPATAFELGAGSRRIVTLAYRAEPGQPTLRNSDLALTVMAVPGSTEEVLITKMLGSGATIEHVTVRGTPAWWISGAPHEIMVKRPDGDVGVVTSALAGDTLVFARDGTLYRLESALGRDATIAIAESMR